MDCAACADPLAAAVGGDAHRLESRRDGERELGEAALLGLVPHLEVPEDRQPGQTPPERVERCGHGETANPLADYHDTWNWGFITTERMTRTIYRSMTD